MPRALPLLALSCLVPLLARAAPESRPRWQYTVTVSDAARGVLDIDWAYSGRVARLCVDMRGGEAGLLGDVVAVGVGALARKGACFVVPGGGRSGLRLRYRYGLSQMAGRRGDPDLASQSGRSFIANDQAFVLRPDPPPPQADIEARFLLPEGFSVAAVWEALPPLGGDPGREARFRYDAAQYDAGAYVALGPLRSLGAIALPGGTARVTLLTGNGAAAADDGSLKGWVASALGTAARFYGALPGGTAHVILAPVPGVDDAGVFGTILRRERPSAVLFFGAGARGPDFVGNWMGVHELFHIGNPPMRRRAQWFVEGVTTYYQDVLRARNQSRSEIDMWGDLYDGFRRFCDPQEGRSLRDESERLYELHNYTRLYWGGACLALRVDVAIRRRSQGKRSLDDVMRALRQRGLQEPLDEEDVIAALEDAAGAKGLVRAHLDALAPIDLGPLYRELGIEPIGPDAVRLRDDAPLAALRRAIMRW